MIWMAFDISQYAPWDQAPASDRTIETVTHEILQLKQDAGSAILGIGQRLLEAKEMLPHGEWLPWLTERVEFSERTAQNFMRLAREWSNPQTLADLGVAKALTLLSLPPEERERFLEETHVVGGEAKSAVDMTSRELGKAVRERDEALRAAADPPAAEAMQVSATKLANLNSIKNGLLDPYLADLWEKGQMSEACALEIVRNVGDSQARLAQWLRDEGELCTLTAVREYEAIHIQLEQGCMISGMPCPNARAMYKAFFRNGSWEGCCGCCGMCNRRDDCPVCCEYVGTVETTEAPEVPSEQLEYTAWEEPDTWEEPSAEPQPEGQLVIAGWMPGGVNPAEPGEFVVLIDLGADGYYRAFMAWNGAGWEMLPSHQRPELPVGWWMRLPPVPEKKEETV